MRAFFLILIFALLAACQLPSGSGESIGNAIRDGIAAGVEAADRDNSGTLTNEEIRGVKNDPNFWIAIGGALLGLLGLGKAAGAQSDAKRLRMETDELYDNVFGSPDGK